MVGVRQQWLSFNQGDKYPVLVNRPSDGSERRGSAILQVVDTSDHRAKSEKMVAKGEQNHERN